MTLTSWLQLTKPLCTYPVRPQLICNDGFSLSIQASSYHLCKPQKNDVTYTHVEVSCLSEEEPLLKAYFKDFYEQSTAYLSYSILQKTIYPYVPVTLVDEILYKHGGICLERITLPKQLNELTKEELKLENAFKEKRGEH